MSVVDQVTRGRAFAESLMLDTFVPQIPGGVEDDGEQEAQGYAAGAPTPGKVQAPSLEGDTKTRTVSVAGVDRNVVIGGLHIPVSAAAPVAGGVGVGWEYLLTVLGPTTPGELLNSRWLVVDSPAKSFMTARRLDVVRLS